MLKEPLHKEIDVSTSEILVDLEKGIERGRKTRSQKRKSKWIVLSVAAAAFLLTGIFSLLHKDDTIKTKTLHHSIKLDMEKEKQALKDAGFFVSRTDLPVDTRQKPSGFRIADRIYNFGLKDFVYNTDQLMKGKVLGVKSYIDQNTVYSEVKLLVEDTLSGKTHPGEVFTLVTTGGIITEYDFWMLNGNKLHLTDQELESSKKKFVVDSPGEPPVFPEDELYVFVGKDQLPVSSSKETLPWASLQIKVTGGKIDTSTNFEMDGSDYLKELSAMKSVDELNSTLKKIVEEKKGYSQEKARKAAFDALTKNDRMLLNGWESARVIYLSQGTYFNGVKSEPNLIKVTFTGKEYMTVYLKDATLEVYKIVKV